jgi:hypothetical protein
MIRAVWTAFEMVQKDVEMEDIPAKTNVCKEIHVILTKIAHHCLVRTTYVLLPAVGTT